MKTSLFTPQNEIDFWSRQLSEHALFLHLGLEDEKLREEARLLHESWEHLRSRVELKSNLPIVVSATNILIDFKEEVISRQRSTWVGWLLPLFIDHIRREAIYFRDALTRSVEEEKDLCSFIEFMKEHAEFAAHLLDPSEQDKIAAARGAGQSFSTLHAGCFKATLPSLLTLSEKQGKALDAFVTNDLPKAKSVIHPVLAAHVQREGRRFLETISVMKKL
jgi:hypothetical protein